MRRAELIGIAALLTACGSDAEPSGSSTSSSGGSSGAATSSSGGSSSGGSSSGGSSGDPGCSDCGTCGESGTVGATAMRAFNFGVDATGRAAMNLNLVKTNECEGQIKRPSTLHVLATNDGIEVTTSAETLDRTKVTKGASQNGATSYAWNDRDLSLKVDNQEAQGLNLTFSNAGGTLFSVKCLPVGETGSCTKE